METEVVALFVHGDRSSRPEDDGPTPMIPIDRVEAVDGQGLREDGRYFRRVVEGEDRKRQVSLIDEGTIQRHEQWFGPIRPELVKSQIVLAGDIPLTQHVDCELVFENGPTLQISLARQPCFAMDFIQDGLREAMKGGKQGALARVVCGGPITIGQRVVLRTD